MGDDGLVGDRTGEVSVATIVIDGVRREVVVARHGDGFVVTVDGRSHDVRHVALVEDGLAFLLGHESHVVRVANSRGGVELSVGGG